MPLIGYAEIHYRWPFVPSRVFIPRPEVVADAPRRTDPGRPIPVIILIKDADRYPVVLDAVVLAMRYENGVERIARFPYPSLAIRERFWWDSVNIIPEYQGTVSLSVGVVFRRGKSHDIVQVDNYRGLSHAPLVVTVADESLPGIEGWFHGDLHCHSAFTMDHIEFGAPLEALALASYCCGLTWFAATDHAYDLDDRIDAPGVADPAFGKWELLRRSADLLSGTVTVLAGEEVTCRTKEGKNAHLLAIGSSTFIPGSGDSGDHGLDTVTEMSIDEAVEACRTGGGIACAAHPREPVSLLERLLLGRGLWTNEDLAQPGLGGIQFANGARDRGFREGKEAWIRLLLAGKRIAALGGSDSHGDLNRRRGLTVPFWGLRESADHLFGGMRTVVRAPSASTHQVLAALHEGRAVVTDGPFMTLMVQATEGWWEVGDLIPPGSHNVRVVLRSTKEFGVIRRYRLYGGMKDGSHEVLLVSGSTDEYEAEPQHRIDVTDVRYLRGECETDRGTGCLTNPLWVAV